MLVDSVNLAGQSMVIDRTASESGGRRDIREDMKTCAAVRTVMIPDIAIPAVRRLVNRGVAGRERSNGQLFERLINGERVAISTTRCGAGTSSLPRATRPRTRTASSGTPPTSCGTCALRCCKGPGQADHAPGDLKWQPGSCVRP